MKFLWIFMFLPFFSCVQAGEEKSSKADNTVVLSDGKAVKDKADAIMPGTDTASKDNASEMTIAEMVKKAETSARIVTSDTNADAATSLATTENVSVAKETKPTPTPKVNANEIIEKQAETQPRVSQVETKTTQSTQSVKPALVETKVKTTPAPEKVVEKKTEKPVETTKVVEVVGKPDHGAFNSLLKSYVSNGNVNYKGFKSSQTKLGAYISDLTSNAPASDWSRNEKLAYWMNLYNAATINLILDNYPLKSIMDLDGGKPWDVKRVTVDGQNYSLNDIEHKIIRPRFKDARIHFAVNCAAKSCPPISNTAFTGSNVNSELDRITKAFINSSANQIAGSSMSISKIFEWYAEDFGDIKEYINKYSSTKVSSDAAVSYIDYDWALNGK